MLAGPAVSFDTLPNLNFNQGQSITVAFAAQGFPTGRTYTAEGLPAGLSMSMGIDAMGHEVGILSGTLAADTPDSGGSEGVYNVRIHSDDGAASNFFAIDVSHWNQGDVFVGGGQWVYQVYREDGSFKTNVTVPDDANITFGATTGCAVNWRTGEVWATNFDDYYPALNVITRHAGSNPLPYTDPSRRLSTERYGAGNSTVPLPGYSYATDIDPESVAFDNDGNMYVGHSFGYWNDDDNVADINGNTIIIHNPNGAGWIYVDGAGQPIVDATGEPMFDTNPISPAGFFEKWIPGNLPFNILDVNGQPIPVPQQGGMDVHKYIPDVNGNYAQTNRQFFDFHYGNTGIDTLDLMSDQKTVVYSSEDWYMYRYDVSGAGTQLPVLGTNVLGASRPINTRSVYGVRVLPPGDGTGGYLAVNEFHIERLDANGNLLQIYDVHGDGDYLGRPEAGWTPGDVNGWFSIAIAPGGRSFWAATRQDAFHFDLASGAVIGPKIHATVGTEDTNEELAGLCVMDEYRAAQEVCGVSGNGNGIDDDHDGTIDEGCFRIEVCSSLSPGDDDGDGLVDYNDPDCGAVPVQQCVTGGPTDNSVAGICDRADYEGDNVVVPGVPLPCNDQSCDQWTFTYSALNLPPGLTMNQTTGEVTGLPLYTIVNPNSELSAPVVYHVTVNSTWQKVGQQASSFTNTFDWTIYNRNRAPVANDDGPQALMAGASFTFNVRSNDSDIDGDTLSIQSFTQPPVGQGSVVQVGEDLQYTAPASGFSGTTTFTYMVKDTYNPAGVSNVATVTVIVNGPPVAVDDNYTAEWNKTLNVPLALGIINNAPGRDSDPENQPITVVASSVTSPANGTVSVNADGSFSYTPNNGFFGTDTYKYRVTDGTLESNLATVTIVVHRPPVAVDDFYMTAVNTPIVLAAPGIMVNDQNVEGGPLNVVMGSIAQIAHGTLAVQPDGSMTYTPNLNYVGDDFFTYRVKNSWYESENATVRIKINAPPVANPNAYTTPEDTTLTIAGPGILTNDTDINNDPLTVIVATATSTSHGTVTLNANGDGGFVYVPNANFHGTDTFTYQVTDGTASSNFTTVTITITPVNDVPVAVNDSFTTAEDVPVVSTLVTNDTPSGDGGNVWSKTSDPSNGTVVVNGNGSFTYTPNPNFNGTDSFTYKVCDVDTDCSSATVTITITPVNDVPVAVNDAFTTAEDTPVAGTLTGNDTPSGDGGNVWSKVSNPSNGTAVVNPDGTFTYTPNANFNGTDSFTYKICDVNNDCSTATVTITITAVNDVPVAVNDAYVTSENTPVSANANVNDTPSGDGGNVWTKTSNPGNGVAVMNNNGTFTYTPNQAFNGTDAFNYRLCDANNDCSSATVTITVTGVNFVPVAVNDAFSTTERTPVSSTLTANDTPSLDGGNVWTKTSNPANGVAVVNTNGTFVYTPNAGFTGTDTFTYQVCDADNDCSTATVTIVIACPPLSTPTALVRRTTMFDAGSLTQGNVQVLTAANSTFNSNARLNGDIFFPGTPTVQINGSPAAFGGTVDGTGSASPNGYYVTINAGASLGRVVRRTDAVAMPTVSAPTAPTGTRNVVLTTQSDSAGAFSTLRDLTLNSNYGNISVPAGNYGTFTANDHTSFTLGEAGSTTPTVYNFQSLNMNGSSSLFVAGPVVVTVGNQVGFNAVAGDVAHVDWLTLKIASGGLNLNSTSTYFYGYAVVPNGALIVNSGASLVGGLAADSLTVNSNARVILQTTSSCVADAKPVAVDDAFTTPQNVPLNASAADNDTASADGGNVWTRTSNPAHGTVTFNADGTFVYTPAPNYFGSDAFDYKVCDADLDCATATVTITINHVNQVPVAQNDAFTTPEDTPVSGTLAGNDVLSGDGGNVWSKVTNPANGSAIVNADGTFIYTPNANFNGTDSFTYRICDVNNDCSVATVVITITPVNDLPVAVNDSYTTAEDTALTATLKTNDTLSGDGGNVWSKVTNPTNGTVVVNADGTFTYTPNANFFGVDSFTYKLCDANNDCSTAIATITITSVNDVPLALDDVYSTAEDTPVSGTVVSNDTLSGDGGNVWTLLTPTSNGTLTFTNGAFTYTPRANFSGTDSFTYKICDVNGDCDNATVTITVTPVNDVPVAANDSYTTTPGTAISKDASNNDTSSGDGGNVWTKTSNPTSGTVVFNSDGTFTYTPTATFTGTVTFNYRLCDATNDCSNATVTITIAATTTGAVGTGDTATIGYWQNQNGQALILKMNGSTSAKNLGNWLAATFPSMWGASAGSSNNMTNKTNTQVAAYYKTVFKSDKKVAQVLAGAIASYVTSSTLAGGNYSVPYGFNYSSTGTGTKTYNVGSNGTAIGLSNNTSYTVGALLQQANLRKQQGNYNTNAFNVIFSGINESGDIK